MSYWWINTDHWFFLRKLWRKQYTNANCQVVYGEWQPVFHTFLYFSYTGVWVPEGLDQALLLLLEAGETIGGPRCGGRRRSWSGKEPAHPPRVPGPEALEGSGLLLPAARRGGSPATEEERTGMPPPTCWGAASCLSKPAGAPRSGGHALTADSWRQGTRRPRLAVLPSRPWRPNQPINWSFQLRFYFTVLRTMKVNQIV